MVKEILAHADVRAAGIHTQYERIELADDFVLRQVIPVFEKYSFADASIDAIGAVFEALARRAEKDNRIGQFFTPETRWRPPAGSPASARPTWCSTRPAAPLDSSSAPWR